MNKYDKTKFMVGLTLYTIGWVIFIKEPSGITPDRIMSILSILYGGWFLCTSKFLEKKK